MEFDVCNLVKNLIKTNVSLTNSYIIWSKKFLVMTNANLT